MGSSSSCLFIPSPFFSFFPIFALFTPDKNEQDIKKGKTQPAQKGKACKLANTNWGKRFFFFILKIQGKKAGRENMKVVREVFHIEN